MQDYRQPDFYKFGHDSLELVEFISHHIGSSDINILEVGTGCGVMAIELALRNNSLLIDALEPQPEFHPYIKENLKIFDCNRVNLISSTFEQFTTQKRYAAIFFNPPYFWHESSRPSPHPQRDLCRRMKKSNFDSWLQKGNALLEHRGKLIFSYRSREVEEMINKWDCFQVIEREERAGCFLIYLEKVS